MQQARCVLRENSKVASLTQEIVRHIKNTSKENNMGRRVEILDKYHRRLKLSLYRLEASRRIMVTGLRGYKRIQKKAARIFLSSSSPKNLVSPIHSKLAL